MRKPYFRKDRGAWYVKAPGGRTQIRLHEEETEAYRVWQEMLQVARPESPAAGFAVLAENFLEWIDGEVAAKTYRRYSDFLASFCGEHGHLRVRDLKPFHVTRSAEQLAESVDCCLIDGGRLPHLISGHLL